MLSVVIPTLDCGATLGACLAALAEADEIVVADGGSRDGTVAIAGAAGARLIASARGRGPQLAAGAAGARGDWLLFLHGDTVLEAGWRTCAERHLAVAGDRPACFRFRLADDAWQARLIEAGVAARVRLLGLPYGDQGLLVSRRLYEQAGGYRPLPLMEDVDLVRRLPRAVPLASAAITSAAKWRRDGWLRRSARNLLCLAAWRVGLPAAWIARAYG
jgi:rSAM/selenodomain-associated transferase 2